MMPKLRFAGRFAAAATIACFLSNPFFQAKAQDARNISQPYSDTLPSAPAMKAFFRPPAENRAKSPCGFAYDYYTAKFGDDSVRVRILEYTSVSIKHGNARAEFIPGMDNPGTQWVSSWGVRVDIGKRLGLVAAGDKLAIAGKEWVVRQVGTLADSAGHAGLLVLENSKGELVRLSDGETSEQPSFGVPGAWFVRFGGAPGSIADVFPKPGSGADAKGHDCFWVASLAGKMQLVPGLGVAMPFGLCLDYDGEVHGRMPISITSSFRSFCFESESRVYNMQVIDIVADSLRHPVTKARVTEAYFNPETRKLYYRLAGEKCFSATDTLKMFIGLVAPAKVLVSIDSIQRGGGVSFSNATRINSSPPYVGYSWPYSFGISRPVIQQSGAITLHFDLSTACPVVFPFSDKRGIVLFPDSSGVGISYPLEPVLHKFSVRPGGVTTVRRLHGSAEGKTLRICPNPAASGAITFSLPRLFSPTTLEIFDAYGRPARRIQIEAEANIANFNAGLLGNGVYFCILRDGSSHYRGKLLIAR